MKSSIAIAFLSALVSLVANVQVQAAPLRIAIVSRTVFYVPLWLAKSDGNFEAQGIDPIIEVYNNAEKIKADLKSGRVQIAISTPDGVIVDAYHGGSLRLIAGNASKLPHFIIAKPAIKSLSQLRGARFGVLSLKEGTTYLVQNLAKIAGLKPGEYTIEAVGGAPTRWRLLKAGKIDVGLQPFPLSYEADAAGFSNLGPISKYIPNYQFTSINADLVWAEKNRKTVVAFLRALQQGQRTMEQNPKRAAAVAAKELKTSVELSMRALQDTARLHILTDDLSLSKPGLAYVFNMVRSAKLIPQDAQFAMDKVVDESFLRESRR